MNATHRRSPRRVLLAAALGGALCSIGCGGADEGPKGSGGSMSAPADQRPLATGAADQPNQPPIIRSVRLEPSQPVPGVPVRAVVSAHDQDGDPIELGYLWTLNGRSMPGSSPQMTFGDLESGDVVAVRVVASDGRGQSEPTTVEGRAGNRPPEIRDIVIHTRTDDEGESVWLVEPIVVDPDGDRVSVDVTWRIGQRVVGREETLRRSGWKRGDRIVVTVVARDAEDESAPLESAPIEIGNAAPDIVSKPPGLDPSGVFRYQIEASDPDGDRGLRYSLGEAPGGMEIDPYGGVVTWKASVDDEGEHKVEVIVDDRNGATAKQVFYLTVKTSRGGSSPAKLR